MSHATQPMHSERSFGHVFIRHWLPVIVWCGLIFFQSAFPPPEQVPRWPHFDKLLHFGAYGLLAALICRALNTAALFHGKPVRLITCGIVLTTLYGLSDEWHQSFVPGRSAELADLLADFAGALVGSTICVKLLRRFRSLQ